MNIIFQLVVYLDKVVLDKLRKFFHDTFVIDGVLQPIMIKFIRKRSLTDDCWRKAWAAASSVLGSDARALGWIRSSCRALAKRQAAASSAPPPDPAPPALPPPPPPPPLYRGFKEEERELLEDIVPDVSVPVTEGWYQDTRERIPALFQRLEKDHRGHRSLLVKIRGFQKNKPTNKRKTLAPELKNYFREHSDLISLEGLENRPEVFLQNIDKVKLLYKFRFYVKFC